MKIGCDPRKDWVSVETRQGTFQFHETDKELEMYIHPLDPQFTTCVEKEGSDFFSGVVYSDINTHSRFYLVLFLKCETVDEKVEGRFILVSLDSGGNVYGISSPGVCHWSKDHPSDPLCSETEMKQILKDHKLEHVDMRASAVPGQCGWHKCHIKDCRGVPDHVTFEGETVKAKQKTPTGN